MIFHRQPFMAIVSCPPKALEDEPLRLRARLGAAIAEKEDLEQRNSELATLYFACNRLHTCERRDEVFGAIIELVVNIVGSEAVGIYETSPDGQDLIHAASFGVDTERCMPRRITGGIVDAAMSKQHFVERRADAAVAEEADVTACIPLCTGARAAFAIIVFRLLPQKPALADFDRELFGMLATHAGLALQATNDRSRADATIPTSVTRS
jgi:nitrate/nitrite-specific signal transduction histidine kinase